jgi:asparagine synthase (glutamine-hydrolysing)
MCGIAGHVGNRRIEPEVLRAALAAMRHRGPDATGIYEHHTGERSVHLLHTRLAILDLDERADQPMRREGRVLCFNGELFNYIEVRRALEREGAGFETRSDTEVLLRCLVNRGVAGLDACEGMWAFALHDQRDGGLLLCRDRFGEKPLFVLERPEGVYFASEIGVLAVLSGCALTVNRHRLHRYLVNGYKSLHKTTDEFFEEVRALAPATVMRIGADGAITESRYWAPSVEPDEGMSRDEAVEGARAALRRAVDVRLRADVPLAFMLSGGVDSNAIVSLARRELGREVHAFTLCSRDERYDEAAPAAASASELGIRHTMVEARGGSFLEDLPALVRHRRAPVSTISYYVHWLLMREVAEAGFRVSVSGTGADEVFSGYYDHHLAYLASLVEAPALRRSALEAWRRHVRPLVRNPFLQDPDLYVDDPAFRGRPVAQPDAQRALPRVGAGHPPRG